MADDRIRWDEKPVRLGKKGFVTWKTAMNELNRRVGLLKNLKPSVENKTNIVNAISGVSERVGLLKNLKTDIKTNIVAAINCLYDGLNAVSVWLGLKTDVDAKYITAHGNTISKLINYLLGRDETVATAASVEEVSAQVSAAATKAENAEDLATTANTTATTASEWLGNKSEVSADTLTHGNTVSALIEYLENKEPNIPVLVSSFGVSDAFTLSAGATHDLDYSWWLPNDTYAVVGVSYHLPLPLSGTDKLMAFPIEHGVRLYNFGTTTINITAKDNFAVNIIAAKMI